MDTQLTLFDQPTAPQINTVPPTSCKIIQFPGTSAVEPPKKVNYRKGEEQTVFPIKSREQLDAMASWLRANADPKYLLAFILGINRSVLIFSSLTARSATLSETTPIPPTKSQSFRRR